ncbi:hypothetical protein D5H75_34590 [Bailinhaonella thermotolerans]|uniref:Uncharacterized protein n=1 Tax=Bailinhaonella thermotolerans TaxID=1070861 RepID=A0A3A4AB23_9ACTN|nr:hypothetical protein D5H75_34590 [Bailinhaonella thermotolerans]
MLVSACANGATLGEAAEVLNEDGAKISRLTIIGDKDVSGGTEREGCDGVKRRQIYKVVGTLGKNMSRIPPSRIADELKNLGYEDAPKNGKSLVVVKKEPKITFTITPQDGIPNISIVGKTDCLTEE